MMGRENAGPLVTLLDSSTALKAREGRKGRKGSLSFVPAAKRIAPVRLVERVADGFSFARLIAIAFP